MTEQLPFEILSDLTEIEILAVGRAIRELPELRQRYGPGRWRKLKGVATVRLKFEGTIRQAEVHWYEAHSIGKKRLKIKRYLD